MGLESTMICVDNSDYMRNGDFVPTRLQAQQDAVNLVCHSKTRSNPENNVGLLTLANVEVLATLTTDVGRILSKLHQVQPKGDINLITGIRIAHLALKHRQGKNHKMRIVAFVGSPVGETDAKELPKLAKRLKKEKVAVDLVSFGDDPSTNSDTLASFISVLNGKETSASASGGSSHLVTVPPGPHLADALLSSPVIRGEDGTGGVGLSASVGGFEFGVDPNEDPELALALRVSMEEQRQRQEDEARRAAAESGTSAGTGTPHATAGATSEEESLLEKALAMSLEQGGSTSAEESRPSTGAVTTAAPQFPDFSQMSEEEQIAYAMQMSMQDAAMTSVVQSDIAGAEETPMEVDDEDYALGKEEDYSEVMSDPAFLQSVLENLPGVDPQSEAIRTALAQAQQQKGEESDEKKQKKKKGGDDKK